MKSPYVNLEENNFEMNVEEFNFEMLRELHSITILLPESISPYVCVSKGPGFALQVVAPVSAAVYSQLLPLQRALESFGLTAPVSCAP